ncbi:hypothetical protein [Streptomyces hydrogenans]|uniref:hypothetical protein n=1 Tax=Streptomyces hydrogenans TaxID=1873719 RepID=UPI00380888B8
MASRRAQKAAEEYLGQARRHEDQADDAFREWKAKRGDSEAAYRAVLLHASLATMYAGLATAEKAADDE